MPDDVTDGELVPVPTPPPKDPAAEAVAKFFGGGPDEEFCSFDPRTPAGLVLLDKCQEDADKNVKELVNMKLRIEHVYAHYVDKVSEETGEVQSYLRVCLITTDGRVHACGSEGVRRSIARLSKQHGMPPWRGGVPVVVNLKNLAGNKQWMTLLNAPDPQTPPTDPAPKAGTRSKSKSEDS